MEVEKMIEWSRGQLSESRITRVFLLNPNFRRLCLRRYVCDGDNIAAMSSGGLKSDISLTFTTLLLVCWDE